MWEQAHSTPTVRPVATIAGRSMKAYLLVTGTVFGLIVLAHLARLFSEGTHMLTEPWWVALTLAAAGLSIWAFRLLGRGAAR